MKNFLRITAKDNSLIKLACALQTSAKERRKNGAFVLEGLRICYDAFDNGIKFDKFIVSDTAEMKLSADIEKLSENSQKCYILPDSLFAKIADTETPQGIMAIAEIPKCDREINKNGRYIALERLCDPSNLGAVARTAEALGVDGILISGDSCDPYSPKALRASMGTLLRMPLFVCEDLVGTLSEMGLRAFACVPDSTAEDISRVDFSDGDVVMIGNEANGLSNEAKCYGKAVTIPMAGKAESLNAAAAAAIAMWEMVKV